MSKIKGLTICGLFWILYMALVIGGFTLGSSMIFSGCFATLGGSINVAGVSLCDQVPEGQTSIICKIADEKGIEVEDAAKVLKFTNLTMLATEQYTAKRAAKFINEVIEDIEEVRKDGVSLNLGQAIEYLNARKTFMPPEVQASLEIIEPGVMSQELISLNLCDYDLYLILLHLERQLDVVRPFLRE